MSFTSDPQRLCACICEDLRELCRQLAQGRYTEPQFIRAILALEEERVQSNGLVLIGSNTSDEWTHFALRSRSLPKLHFGFEFNPVSGEFREVPEP